MIDPIYWLNSLPSSLLRASWQGAILAMLVWSLCRFIPTIPARLQCWLWRLVLVKFLVTLFWLSPVELPLLPAPVPEFLTDSLPDQTPGQTLEVLVDGVPDPQPNRIVPILIWLWLVLAAGQFAMLVRQYNQARHLRRNARLVTEEKWTRQLQSIAPLFGLKNPPRLLECDQSISPLLLGIVSPAIILPARTLSGLDDRERGLVLSHELAHLRRGDLVWTLVAALARACFFFHPLVWLAEKRLNLAQEIAADNLAKHRQFLTPADYGALLVSVVSKLGPVRVFPTMSVGTAGSLDSLKERLVAMRYFGASTGPAVISTCMLLGLIAWLGIIPWRVVHGTTPQAPDEKKLYEARIKFSETAPGIEKVELTAPRILFVPGKTKDISVAFNANRIVVQVESDPGKMPITHHFKVKVLANANTKGEEKVLFRPNLVLQNNSTGTAKVTSENGTLEIEITVAEVKKPEVNPPKKAGETPSGK